MTTQFFKIGQFVQFASGYSGLSGAVNTGKVTSCLGLGFYGVTPLKKEKEMYFRADELQRIDRAKLKHKPLSEETEV